MVCPKCKSEFREGITRCPDCECELVSAIDAEKPSEVVEFMKPVKVYECETQLDATMIQEALRNESIQNFIRGNGSGDYLKIGTGLDFLGWGIYVDETDESRAVRIIAELTQNESEDTSVPVQDIEEQEVWNILEEGQRRAHRRKRLTACIILGAAVFFMLLFFVLSYLT